MSESDYLKRLPSVEKLVGKKVTLLLGTDEHIEEGSLERQERRVGITPNQAAALKTWLQSVGIFLDFYFVQGAGSRAGYFDGDYLNAGGQLIFEHQLATLPAPNVLHALKEPCPYEAFVPGPFIRIGALHSGAFDPTSGLASLLKKKNFCAIFDGSAVGGYSYQITNDYPIPIRSSMSIFAGHIAADEIGESLLAQNRSDGKIVISGAGVVGSSAAKHLLTKYKDCSFRIHLVEADEKRAKWCRNEFKNTEVVRVFERTTLNNDDLNDANGLILSAFKPGYPAPKVVAMQDLKYLADHAVIVDVSIDEKGSIATVDMDFEKASLGQVIKHVREEIKRIGKNLSYIADSHLPRKYPDAASESHGRAILSYLAVLLYLCAREGGAPQAVQYILAQNFENSHDYFNALICDLKNGLAYRRPDPIYVNAKMKGVLNYFQHFLKHEGIDLKIDE